jgi:hypothetical protein
MNETGVSPAEPLSGTWPGGPSIGNVENLLKEGAGYGESLSVGALLGKPGRGSFLLVSLEDR